MNLLVTVMDPGATCCKILYSKYVSLKRKSRRQTYRQHKDTVATKLVIEKNLILIYLNICETEISRRITNDSAMPRLRSIRLLLIIFEVYSLPYRI